MTIFKIQETQHTQYLVLKIADNIYTIHIVPFNEKARSEVTNIFVKQKEIDPFILDSKKKHHQPSGKAP